MSFAKFVTAAGLAVSLAGPVSAEGTSQLERRVEQILPQYGYENVDVSELETAQLAQIVHLASSKKGQGEIRGQIGAVLGNSILSFLRG